MNAVESQAATAHRVSGCGVSRQPRWFVISAGGILLITGVAKVASVTGSARVLQTSDPFFTFSFRNELLLVGMLELIIACFCLLSRRPKIGTCAVAWLATGFLVYRVGLWSIGWQHPCHCMGNLSDTLRMSPQVADRVMKFVLAYLLVGSYLTLASQFWNRGRAPRRLQE